MTKKLLALALIATITGLGIQGIQSLTKPASSTKSGCITIYVDYGSLVPSSPAEKCVDASGSIYAEELLGKSGYTLEGTRKYPDQIVCRVNNLPSPEVEGCKDMPPADAYWAIIVNENGHWDWAQTGIASVELEPGQGIGLVYVIDGQINFPS